MKELHPTLTEPGSHVVWKASGKMAGKVQHFICPAPGSTRMRVRILHTGGRPGMLGSVFYADQLLDAWRS